MIDRNTIDEIKDVVQTTYEVFDLLEELGVSFSEEDNDPDMNLRDTLKTEVLCMFFRVVDNKEELIREENLNYINECLDWDLTPKKLERGWNAFIHGDPEQLPDRILALFIFYDNTMHKNKYSMIYVRLLSIIMRGYLGIEGNNSTEKVVRYYRLIRSYIMIIQMILVERVNFDPLDGIDQKTADIAGIRDGIENEPKRDDPEIQRIAEAIINTVNGRNNKNDGAQGDGHTLTLTNKDIKEYRPMDLPYHFVLFHHINDAKYSVYKYAFGANDEENALLTYCYLDEQAGLSYRAICWAVLSDDGKVEYHIDDEAATDLIIREGGIDASAELIDEDDPEMERFRGKAERIKENYGCHKEKTRIRDDIPFGKQRHPAYPDDIMVLFISPDHKMEQIWVREQSHDGDRVIATLLNEPYSPSFGLHEGDTVTVIPVRDSDGEVIPMAMLDWMKKQGNI